MNYTLSYRMRALLGAMLIAGVAGLLEGCSGEQGYYEISSMTTSEAAEMQQACADLGLSSKIHFVDTNHSKVGVLCYRWIQAGKIAPAKAEERVEMKTLQLDKEMSTLAEKLGELHEDIKKLDELDEDINKGAK